MAIGSNHVVQSRPADVRDTSGFIPELWSQEVLRAYKQNIALSYWTDSKIYFLAGSNPENQGMIDGS